MVDGADSANLAAKNGLSMIVQRCRWITVNTMLMLVALATTEAMAQAPFPPDALVKANSQQSALSAIGANQAEMSGYLLLEAPEIALPGKFKAQGKSQLPGTSQMVLLRVTRAQAGQALEKPFVAGRRIVPGKPASIDAEIDAAATLNLILLAQSRGKWFYAMREVKVGRSPSAP